MGLCTVSRFPPIYICYIYIYIIYVYTIDASVFKKFMDLYWQDPCKRASDLKSVSSEAKTHILKIFIFLKVVFKIQFRGCAF